MAQLNQSVIVPFYRSDAYMMETLARERFWMQLVETHRAGHINFVVQQYFGGQSLLGAAALHLCPKKHFVLSVQTD